MDTTNEQQPKITLTTLSLALKRNDNKLALQKLSVISMSKILDAREQWFNVQQDLISKKRQLDELENDKKRKGRKELIKHFTEDVEKLETKLSKTMYLPMLIELSRHNEEELLDTLQLMVLDVVKYYHTTEKMTEPQIYETAFRIVDAFKGLTLEDVALCFHQAKSGLYGGVYNRIDGAVLLDWLHKYQDKMQAAGIQREMSRHLQGKGSTYKNGGEYRISDIRNINHYFK